MWRYCAPELIHYHDGAERNDAIRRWRGERRRAAARLMQLTAGIIAVPLMTLAVGLAFERFGIWSLWLIPVLGAITGLLLRIVLVRLYGSEFRAFLRRDLLFRGTCWQCGYDLTGNRSGRCPECGTTLESDAAQPAESTDVLRQ